MITVPIRLYFTTKSYAFEGGFRMPNRDNSFFFFDAIVAVPVGSGPVCQCGLE
ncbi:hypothetical protein LEMLEM_LOCUS657 [Lemmus lemmus]